MKLILAWLALTAATQPKTQFDLVCTGAGAVSAEEQIAFKPADLHLRLDLAAKRWCEGDCKVIHEIAEVQPARIIFEKETEAEELQHLIHIASVDRETGEYMSIHEFMMVDTKGTVALKSKCDPAPFSGFPKIETKF